MTPGAADATVKTALLIRNLVAVMAVSAPICLETVPDKRALPAPGRAPGTGKAIMPPPLVVGGVLVARAGSVWQTLPGAGE